MAVSTLRERNRQRTRQEIEAAAMALFADQGFDATTIEQIAAAAGIAPRTFFRYFATKEDAVFADHAQNVARLRAALAPANPDEPLLSRVRRAVLAVQFARQDPALQITRARLIGEVPSVRARSYQLAEELEAVVAEAIAIEVGQEADAVAQTNIIAGAVFGALRGARRAAVQLPAPDPLRLVEVAFDIVENGARRYLPSQDRDP